MSWITQSFGTMIASALMVVLVTSQTKNGISVYFSMFVISLVWLPSFFWKCCQSGIGFTATGKTWLVLLLAGVFSVLGNIWQFEAAGKAPNPGLVMAIIGSQAILIAMLSFYFLKIPITRTQILGIIVCVVGIGVIALGK